MSKTLSSLNIELITFGTEVDRINEIINALATEIVTANTVGARTDGSGFVNGHFGSNTIHATTLVGGNLTATTDMNVASNVVFDAGMSVFFGNSTANGSINSVLLALVNATGNVAHSPGLSQYGNATANTSMNSTAVALVNATGNVAHSPGLSQYGNSTANALVSATLIHMVNATANAQLSPGEAAFGNSTVYLLVNSSLINTTGGALFGANVSGNGSNFLDGFVLDCGTFS